MTDQMTNQPAAALARLLEGNRRYLSGNLTHGAGASGARRAEVAEGQAPFATVVACADSRVTPEYIFDVGLGEIFVCRNAGNLADDDVVGSLEYAAIHTGCPLLCIVGHSRCGAATAAVEADGYADLAETPCIASIVRAMSQAVAVVQGDDADGVARIDAAARANVEIQCKDMMLRSDAITQGVAEGRVGIVGLWYDLDSGEVTTIVPLLVGAEARV